MTSSLFLPIVPVSHHDRGNQEEDRGDQEEDRADQEEEIGNATTSSKKKVRGLTRLVKMHDDFRISKGKKHVVEFDKWGRLVGKYRAEFSSSSNERIAELEKQLDAERKLRELKDEDFKHLSVKMQSKDEESKHLSATVQEQGLQLQAIASFLASQGMTLPQSANRAKGRLLREIEIYRFIINGGLGTGGDSSGVVRVIVAGIVVADSREEQSGGLSILVHTVIYFGLVTIFLIAIGVHIYTG
ncbi:hypothetical protein L6452_13239 [Arctium lappa]|uniref:Uncharacterized protein n=1 Tax=Arctium lappa TaxID=4217 RepID=A0ACB9CHQ7_ARCLA|nr:hypothetical protein L6452_13239 [Arctium lappa]